MKKRQITAKQVAAMTPQQIAFLLSDIHRRPMFPTHPLRLAVLKALRG